MAVIYYNLHKAMNLEGMVATAGGSDADNDLPNDKAIYVVYNTHNDNVYVGIAVDIKDRYKGRAEAVSVFGLEKAYMKKIIVYYGDVWVYDTPVGGAGPALGPFPVGGLLCVPAADVGAHLGVFTHNKAVGIGGQTVDLEKLLIRFYLKGPGPAKSSTNTMLATSIWTNNTGRNIDVYCQYTGIDGIPAGSFGDKYAPLVTL